MVQTAGLGRAPSRSQATYAAGGTEAENRPTPWTPERWALLVLVVLPVLVFAVPALLGHPVDPGDDLTQNYPLRILVGQQLRSGHLPLFDPYIWSGAPLLAGWNAGAAYPLTWLFAVLPGVAAWTLGLLVTWWVAGIGLFVFLRASRLAVLPSVLGALTFAFAGAMTDQVTHFGLLAGASWIPLQLLAVMRLTERGRRSASMAAWCAVLAVTVGMTFLAGEPRAVDVAAAALVPYALWRLVRLGRSSPGPASWVAAGGALGVALGAVQLLPGLAAVATSQRAGGGVVLYSSGSMPVRWLLLLLVPDLMGGSGSFGQPAFFGTYSLTEITAYVGLLPLVGAFALLGQLRVHRPLPDWLVWHVVAVVGVLLAMGTHTPAWHLFAAVPLSGAERLPSRDLMVLDLALAVLFAYWLDGWLAARRREPAEPAPRPAETSAGRSTALGALPALGALATVIVALVWGAGFLDWLGLTRSVASVDGGLKPWLVPWLVLSVLVLVLVVAGPRLEARRRSRLMVAFFAADVVAYTLLTVVAVAPGLDKHHSASTATSTIAVAKSAAGTTAASTPAGASATSTGAPAYPLAEIVGTGRFAIYDPGLRDSGQLTTMGTPDDNVVSGFPSVQGYGSIEDATYAAATGTHLASGGGQDQLSPSALRNGTFDQLGMTTLATLSLYLLTPLAGQPGAGSVQPGPPGTGRRHLAPRDTTVWYLGTPLLVHSVSVPLLSAASSGDLGVGLETASGKVQWLATQLASGGRILRASVGNPAAAVALVVRAGPRALDVGVPTVSYPNPSPAGPGSPADVTAAADGLLTDALTTPRWRYAGTDGEFAIYHDTESVAPLTLAGIDGRSARGASLRAMSGPSFAPDSATVSSPSGVEVIRSAADIPGSTASWQPAGGASARPLPVRRHGLVQAVVVPAGTGVLSWSYHAPRFMPGAAVSSVALALLALLALLLGLVLRARRRSRRGVA